MPQATKQRLRVPVNEWPLADREAFELAIMEPDPFDEVTTRASKWKKSTSNLIASSYGQWLAWLAHTGQLDLVVTAGERATHERVVAFRDHMRSRGLAEYTVSGSLKRLGDALEAIEPGGSFRWINRAAARLHANASPRKNVREVMQPAEDVYQLGIDLMHAADYDRFRTETDRATLFRDGLILSLLVLRPLRRGNLASLDIADRLQQGDAWVIRIAGEDTKNQTAIHAPWPMDLVAPLERYLSTHRPVLLRTAKDEGRDCTALWISRQGGPMTDEAIYTQIRNRTQDEFGVAMHTHAFRYVGATTIATSRPDEVANIMSVLGHGSPRTGEKYYNLAQTVGAGERLLATVSDARRQAATRARARKALGR